MTNYNVHYTDDQKTPITMVEGTEDNTTLDLSIFGNTFLEYGQELNENILHLLENFACPMGSAGGNIIANATPNTTNGSYNSLLTRPTEGQIWYNTTLRKLYYWDGAHWRPISSKNDIAANWGLITDGFQIPRPVSATTGHLFNYVECIWSVSPANFGGTFDYMACSTDNVGTVNMKYRNAGSTTMTSGVANYLIIGIRANLNHGTGFAMTPPAPSASSVGPTPTASNTPTHTPTPSTTRTLTASPLPSGTLPPTPSNTASQTPSHTPTRTPTRTPSQTPSHTPTRPASPTPSNTPIPPTPSSSPIQPLVITTYGPTSLLLTGQCGFAGPSHTCLATTTANASVNPSGGVPPYTYQWQNNGGSSSIVIDNPTSFTTVFRSSWQTPAVSGGTCDSCTAGVDGCPSPHSGSNIRCSQVRCKITDSIGNTIFSPTFNLKFFFNNTQ